MAKINLVEQLTYTGQLNSQLIVSSLLIDKLEVYGYVNSCKKELLEKDIIDEIFKSFVGMNARNEVVCSDFLLQNHRVYPIYNSLYVAENDDEIELKELYIPSLRENESYKKIRSRQSSLHITPSIQKNLPSKIIYKNNTALFPIKKGDIICKDRHDATKSVAEELLAVCRYVDKNTGEMLYTQFRLNELLLGVDTVYDKNGLVLL